MAAFQGLTNHLSSEKSGAGSILGPSALHSRRQPKTATESTVSIALARLIPETCTEGVDNQTERRGNSAVLSERFRSASGWSTAKHDDSCLQPR